MNKFFVTKGQIGFLVVHEAFDKNAGNYYSIDSKEFETESEAQKYADYLNTETYYIDEKTGLPVTPKAGIHFDTVVYQEYGYSPKEFNNLSDEEKEAIYDWYVAEYIPR